MGRLLFQVEQEDVESRTFVLMDEGHTLGNALRTVISDYPEVESCGYAPTHPAEVKILFRIQTKGGNAVQVLKRGFQDLEKICDHTLETFDKAYEKYKSSQGTSTDT